MLHVLRLTLLLCLLCSSAAAGDASLADRVDGVMEQARKDGAEMSLPVNTHQEDGRKAAEEAAGMFLSPQFQERLQCEKKRIGEELLSDSLDARGEAGPVSGRLAGEEKVYLFLSSSMPDAAVHAYLATVEHTDEPNLFLLLKGFAPGERERYLVRITRKDLGCRDQLHKKSPDICERYEIPVRLEPSLFDRYDITEVPALVYERGEEAWKISGDAALEYLLERINREAHSSGLEGLINTLRGD